MLSHLCMTHWYIRSDDSEEKVFLFRKRSNHLRIANESYSTYENESSICWSRPIRNGLLINLLRCVALAVVVLAVDFLVARNFRKIFHFQGICHCFRKIAHFRRIVHHPMADYFHQTHTLFHYYYSFYGRLSTRVRKKLSANQEVIISSY